MMCDLTQDSSPERGKTGGTRGEISKNLFLAEPEKVPRRKRADPAPVLVWDLTDSSNKRLGVNIRGEQERSAATIAELRGGDDAESANDAESEDDALLFGSPVFRSVNCRPSKRANGTGKKNTREKYSVVNVRNVRDEKSTGENRSASVNKNTVRDEIAIDIENIDIENTTTQNIDIENTTTQNIDIENTTTQNIDIENNHREKRKRSKEEREADRNLALFQKEAQKTQKKERILQEQRARGKFAKEEIRVHLEKRLDASTPQLRAALREAEYAVSLQEDREGSVRWSQEEHLGVVALVLRPGEFLGMLPGEGYPLLKDRLDGVRRKGERVVVLLPEVEAEIRRRWRNGVRKPSAGDLQDAMVWMAIEEGVECEIASSMEETTTYLLSLTKTLSEAKYYQRTTELDCVKKLRASKEAISPFDRASDCWLRQLQQLPGMSTARAMSLVRHFPTPRALTQRYEDPTLTEDQKRTLVASCLEDGRNFVKFSDGIYRFMTTEDSLELVF